MTEARRAFRHGLALDADHSAGDGKPCLRADACDHTGRADRTMEP
ncbi:hypothetical protein [Streptomyces sp. NPDC001743]